MEKKYQFKTGVVKKSRTRQTKKKLSKKQDCICCNNNHP